MRSITPATSVEGITGALRRLQSRMHPYIGNVTYGAVATTSMNLVCHVVNGGIREHFDQIGMISALSSSISIKYFQLNV